MTIGIRSSLHDKGPGSRSRAALQRALRPVLASPLPTKIAGANLLIVVVAVAVVSTVRGAHPDRTVMLVSVAALLLAVAINVVLVTFALKPLHELERTVWRVWGGKLESRVPDSLLADDELRRVSRTLNYLLEELAKDRTRARSLASSVVQAADKERARVGRELHDSIAQTVAAIRFQLMAIEQDVPEPELAAKLRDLQAGAGGLLEDIRLLSLSTHPRILADLGLVPALRHLARAVAPEPKVAITVSSEAEASLRLISPAAAGALYSVAQEALGNAIHHASASSVDVKIEVAEGTVQMQILDNGIGFDLETVEANQSSAGLFAMRERTTLANGVFTIVSAPGRGTAVHVHVPAGAPLVTPA